MIMAKLVVITSPKDGNLIQAETKLTQTTNKPFTRNGLIMDKLSKIFGDAEYITCSETIDEIEAKLRQTDIVNDAYFNFLKNAWESFAFANNIEDEMKSPYDGGLINYVFSKNNNNLHHLPYYLQCGFYGNDYCTSIFSHTFEAAIRSAYNGIIALDYVKSNNVIYCANIFPGHHATNSSYSGYCFLNNAAICATWLKYNKRCKIAILDIDFHHGDGTQKIFSDEDDILTISLHGDPSKNYPFYTGYVSENNSHNFNFLMSKNVDINVYSTFIKSAMTIINNQSSEYLIIAFGADTYKNDPQGYLNINIEDYITIGRQIRENFSGPIIVTQEGGYCMEVVADIVSNFISGLTK